MDDFKSLTNESVGTLVRESTTDIYSKLSESVETIIISSAAVITDVLDSTNIDNFVFPINYDSKEIKVVVVIERKHK